MWTLLGPVESVLIREVSSIQGWIIHSGAPQCGHCWGPVESVLIREVSSILGWNINSTG